MSTTQDNQNKTELITRRQSAAMRGIAILAIMLHNYCHWLPMVQENEYTYTQAKADRLWTILMEPGTDLLAQLLSFFGHYGVPVFVFLSAYGLVMKYESPLHLPEGSAWKFIWGHYKKLFLMMVVGYTAFVMVDYMTPRPRHYELWNVIGQLGMFSNLYDDPDHVIWPGPYWYFGLMVQLYVVYRLVIYKGKGSLGGLLTGRAHYVMLAVLFLATLLGQCAFGHESQELEWYRYNFMGSLPVFIAGICYARMGTAPRDSKWENVSIFVLMTTLILLCSDNFAMWLVLPFAVCAGTLALVRCLPDVLLSPLAWVGGVSAAIFVCHPITRKVIIPISRHGELYAGLLLYLVATLVLAIVFKHLNSIVSRK